jgi:hypothetical protein
MKPIAIAFVGEKNEREKGKKRKRYENRAKRKGGKSPAFRS